MHEEHREHSHRCGVDNKHEAFPEQKNIMVICLNIVSRSTHLGRTWYCLTWRQGFLGIPSRLLSTSPSLLT